MARKPSALAHDLLRNFPKGRRGRRRRRKGAKDPDGASRAPETVAGKGAVDTGPDEDGAEHEDDLAARRAERDAAADAAA
jgi:ribonuclease E